MTIIIIHMNYISKFYIRIVFFLANWLNSILYIKNIDMFYSDKRGTPSKPSVLAIMKAGCIDMHHGKFRNEKIRIFETFGEEIVKWA